MAELRQRYDDLRAERKAGAAARGKKPTERGAVVLREGAASAATGKGGRGAATCGRR